MVLIGKRQKNREVNENVILVEDFNLKSIKDALKFQLNNGKYKSSNIYGSGNASEIILNTIATKLSKNISLQKKLHYSFN